MAFNFFAVRGKPVTRTVKMADVEKFDGISSLVKNKFII